jgi:hypothetical protein
MTRRALLTCIAAGLALAAVSVPAWGTRTVKIPSKVTIASNGAVMHGHVESPNSACIEGRKVKLKRVISGGRDQVMGTSTTNANGRWRVTVSGFAGVSLAHFYARVRRRAEGTAGTIYVCRPDRSREIMLGG